MMEKTKNRSQKLNMEMVSVIMALAWPTMLEQLMQTAVQYIDTAMVGSLGTQATAAVGATSTVNWLIGSTISALSVGFLSFIARSCGAGDKESAKKSVSQAVVVVLITGVFFTGLTLAETAQALSIPPGTVSTRQRRALALLRLDLCEEE